MSDYDICGELQSLVIDRGSWFCSPSKAVFKMCTFVGMLLSQMQNIYGPASFMKYASLPVIVTYVYNVITHNNFRLVQFLTCKWGICSLLEIAYWRLPQLLCGRARILKLGLIQSKIQPLNFSNPSYNPSFHPI